LTTKGRDFIALLLVSLIPIRQVSKEGRNRSPFSYSGLRSHFSKWNSSFDVSRFSTESVTFGVEIISGTSATLHEVPRKFGFSIKQID
jgi:hypothetical protein